jgi:hypothetical protein
MEVQPQSNGNSGVFQLSEDIQQSFDETKMRVRKALANKKNGVLKEVVVFVEDGDVRDRVIAALGKVKCKLRVPQNSTEFYGIMTGDISTVFLDYESSSHLKKSNGHPRAIVVINKGPENVDLVDLSARGFYFIGLPLDGRIIRNLSKCK